MRNSRGRSFKHAHLFHYEDQISQEHKKIVKERLESNHSFRAREIPIQRLFNVGHFTNASGEFSGFSKGKNFSAVMDYDIPELVVFIQEDQQQFVKDISIDRGVSPEGKCVSEDCELDHGIISRFFDPDMNIRRDSNLRTMDSMSMHSKRPEYASKPLSLKDAMELYDCRSLMLDGEADHDSGYKISTDHPTKKTASETLREALVKETEFSRSFKHWQINSYLGTTGSRVEFPHSADCVQVTDTSMCKTEMSNSQSLRGPVKRQVDYPQEFCFCATGPRPGPTSYAALATTTSSTVSHHSNDSMSSTHSFAFPILPVEWSGSPVKMLEAEKTEIRRHRWQKIWIWLACCKY